MPKRRVPKRGRCAPKGGHSRGGKLAKGLTKVLEDHEKRLQAVESRLNWTFSLPRQQPPAIKPGAKPKLARQDLFERRDRLSDCCGYHWPEFSWAIQPATSAADLRKRLGALNFSEYREEEAKRLIENCDALWEFTQSRRFHGDPRQVADAMAGVPELRWRTSFNVCQANPTRIPLHLRAEKDYLRRKFPERFLDLLAARTEREVLAALRKARTEDPLIADLKSRPEMVFQVLEEGLPRWAAKR